jgi:hypothetical protein
MLKIGFILLQLFAIRNDTIFVTIDSGAGLIDVVCKINAHTSLPTCVIIEN